jgi:hypothetical protein
MVAPSMAASMLRGELDLPELGHLVLLVLVAPGKHRKDAGERCLLRGHVGGADQRPEDVDGRHGVGDNGRAAYVFKGARPVLARLEVERHGGRARGRKVDGAVEHAVVSRSGSRKQHAARKASHRLDDELARQANDARLPVNPCPVCLELS